MVQQKVGFCSRAQNRYKGQGNMLAPQSLLEVVLIDLGLTMMSMIKVIKKMKELTTPIAITTIAILTM